MREVCHCYDIEQILLHVVELAGIDRLKELFIHSENHVNVWYRKDILRSRTGSSVRICNQFLTSMHTCHAWNKLNYLESFVMSFHHLMTEPPSARSLASNMPSRTPAPSRCDTEMDLWVSRPTAWPGDNPKDVREPTIPLSFRRRRSNLVGTTKFNV